MNYSATTYLWCNISLSDILMHFLGKNWIQEKQNANLTINLYWHTLQLLLVFTETVQLFQVRFSLKYLCAMQYIFILRRTKQMFLVVTLPDCKYFLLNVIVEHKTLKKKYASYVSAFLRVFWMLHESHFSRCSFLVYLLIFTWMIQVIILTIL